MTFIALADPFSGEVGAYNRFEQDCIEFTTPTVTVKWQPENALPAGTRLRALAYGPAGVAVVSGWQTAVAGLYAFTWTSGNGHFAVAVEVENTTGHLIIAKAIIVNTTGAPLPNPTPLVALTRFEQTAGGSATVAPQQVTFPGSNWRPYKAKVKARTVTPFNTRVSRDALHCRAVWGPNMRGRMFRTYKRSPVTKTLYVAAWQKYQYDLAISLGSFKAGLMPPTTLVRDGPRNFAHFGYVAQARLRRGGASGYYFAETDGRIGFHRFNAANVTGLDLTNVTVHAGEGYVDTFVGWRTTDALQVGRSEEGLEYIGDFSLAKGFKRLHEPWSVAPALRKADGSIDNRDGNDLWFTSTMDHWVGYVDVWGMHPDVSQFTGRPSVAQFAPAGYPGTVRNGVARVVHLFGNPATVNADGSVSGSPSTHVNQPWRVAMRPQDGKIYFSNFGGHSFARGNPDGTGLETILKGNKTDAQLGIPGHLQPSSIPMATLRTFIKDGPLADPTTSCICPQAFEFDSQGNIIYVERYTYVIRKIDLTAMTVTTLALMNVQNTSGSAGTQDFDLAIDSDGTFGPQDDIFVVGWAGSAHWRYDKSGAFIGDSGGKFGLTDLAVHSLRNGQWSHVDPPNYSWGIDVHAGKFIWFGHEGGSQLVEVTARQPGDPVLTDPQESKVINGQAIYQKYFLQTHGAFGYGELGYPNVEEMGSWTDATLLGYLVSWGGTAAEAPDFTAWVRHRTCDLDYTAPPPDTTPPLPAATQGSISFTWSPTMPAWSVIYRNTASASADVKKAALYIDGVLNQEIDVTPSQLFTMTFTLPPSVVAQIGVSFKDAVPNESAQVVQSVSTPAAPDLQAPDPALGPGTIASMTWIP